MAPLRLPASCPSSREGTRITDTITPGPLFPAKHHPELAAYLSAHTAVDASTGCWVWSGPVNDKGVGRASPSIRDTFGTISIPRLAVMALTGSLPAEGTRLRQSCGNPRCCCPDHRTSKVTEREATKAARAEVRKALSAARAAEREVARNESRKAARKDAKEAKLQARMASTESHRGPLVAGERVLWDCGTATRIRGHLSVGRHHRFDARTVWSVQSYRERIIGGALFRASTLLGISTELHKAILSGPAARRFKLPSGDVVYEMEPAWVPLDAPPEDSPVDDLDPFEPALGGLPEDLPWAA